MNSRLIAANVLVKVLSGKSMTAALETAWEQVSDVQEKAFIQALCYGTVRQYYRLEFILNQLVNKPIKNKDVQIKALALLGLYQLKYMRVKDHAAVSETVAVMNKKQWAKSLLNALLRRYLREQEQLEALADKHVAYAHPDWMIKAIKADWGSEAKQIFLENNLAPPMSLRVNTRFCSRDTYLTMLAEQEIEASALEYSEQGVILVEPVAVEKLPKFSEGWVSVQDAAAQLSAQLLDAQAGQRVLDVCAAPGGKTAHTLECQPDLKTMLACDIDAQRLLRVKENLTRLHLAADLLTADATKPEEWWDGVLFERILLDAPCSALGVVRRHPDIKLLRRAEDIAQLQAIQQDILRATWGLLAPGGILLYATCSILQQENECQIERFLQQHDDALELPIEAAWGVKRPFGRQVLTGSQSMDGFYYARLQKK
ncbi:16S rRNA (cytosine967-C5)-methyltransferase [Bathymodiolus platifrons methanotrophic gill symbiont]|uniref:16S rRNA (cytosine(967)-C(5))-methyltransferase RsmB n=1 Tax=Bathymodiolus platifrons methanotrophic gill symbiont TaxID=113268 RepID=UPI000B41B456|nr:16S rRNA (cytosine(967)-C(5))-methyltransferase RsmB [Bathymodiolus platifrons methanotrophic gill symbiont]TXL04280.1 16S rRNA (cytosine(967)-C(5))-methyltransferase [Methylococcaceae bacterium CS1]TXL14621.1 16S rRNA (cytosine(967)-C(5))-methyltransferase [Methylococcaceae bacterium HT4]TXL18907.1 16S rRNA (cytosine(967)-C(5))-methyltransferase [Methylococcaceae bacterium HT5]GAW87060.1 16S rRNA (cytosine967-C5)-methyltransferase [Bathymodiolus platifrons methanotrophic gill symbiont]GFO7